MPAKKTATEAPEETVEDVTPAPEIPSDEDGLPVLTFDVIHTNPLALRGEKITRAVTPDVQYLVDAGALVPAKSLQG